MAIRPPKRRKKNPAELAAVSAKLEIQGAKRLASNPAKCNNASNELTGWKNPLASVAADYKMPLQQLCCGRKSRSSPISEQRSQVARKSYSGHQNKNLADYLDKSGPRLVNQFGSTEFYPTDDARSVIQGIITTVLDLKIDEVEHGHLLHPENYILGEKRYYPYSKYVRDLATGDVVHNRRLLQNVDEGYPDSIEVRLEDNRKDLKSDDIVALRFIIFDVILTLDGRRPLLSSEWEEFRDLFYSSDPDFALISSHSCLWGFKKRLQCYRQLDDWCNPSKAKVETRNLLVEALSSMPILRRDWAKRVRRDKHLARFVRKIVRSRQQKPYGLIRVFRNIVEHCQETAPAASPYRDGRYLDYKLRRIFPNLLEDIQYRLLHAGFIY